VRLFRPVTQTEGLDAGQTWDSALAAWRNGRSMAFLRTYSDAVNRSLLDAWLPAGSAGRLLKTDLFDEAVGEGLVPALNRHAAEVVAIDISPSVIERARRRYPGLAAHEADTRRLPFPEASFDVVFSNSTLDHFARREDIAVALTELHRVLKPGGRLLVTLDNAVNPFVRLRNALPGPLVRSTGLVPYPVGTTCGPRRLRLLLERCGFHVEAERALMHFPRVAARAAAVVARPDSSRLLRAVMAFERLGRGPARYLTGQFVAAAARKR
jgi:SAM-dependent methyltransferase